MDIKKYISSGVLELYVFGMLPEAERKAVEQNMLKYPEIKAEVNVIEKSLELYAEGTKMQASPGLEASIMDKVNQTDRVSPDKVVAIKGVSWLTYVLGILLIAIAGMAFWFYTQQKECASELDNTQTALQQSEDAGEAKDATIEILNQQLDALINPNVTKYDMNGTDKAPRAIASVFYNKLDKKTYLNIGTLPSPPTGKQYQLWALVNGTPVDMGVFDIQPNGDTAILEVPFIENPGAFAVTLETLGGNPSPNLDELYVYGETS